VLDDYYSGIYESFEAQFHVQKLRVKDKFMEREAFIETTFNFLRRLAHSVLSKLDLIFHFF